MHHKALLLILALLCAYATSPADALEDKPLTIGLIGDSTVATTYGWGPALEDRLNEHGRILHYAKNGATLDSLSKKCDELIDKQPAFILIQFGHNDMKRYDTQAYSEKLTDYVKRIKQAGIKPIILSSVTRRTFGDDGKIKPATINGRTLAEYALAAKAVAEKQAAPFIDLNTITIAHHNKLGPEASAAYNFKETDRTHFSKFGAKQTAALILPELVKAAPQLQAVFKPE